MGDTPGRSRIPGETLLSWVNRRDPYRAPQLVILTAILLDLSLPHKVSPLNPTWVLPALEGLAPPGLLSLQIRRP